MRTLARVGVRGLPERDMISLHDGMGGWGWEEILPPPPPSPPPPLPPRFFVLTICCPWIKGLCRFCRRLRHLLWATSVFHNAIVKKYKRHNSSFRRKCRRKYDTHQKEIVITTGYGTAVFGKMGLALIRTSIVYGNDILL